MEGRAPRQSGEWSMGRFAFAVVILLLGGIAAGGIFLMTWEIPAPQKKVEKVIPNERFEP